MASLVVEESTQGEEVVFDLTTKLKLTILQGKDLAAKDFDLTGKRTSSDPYVEIWAYNVLVGTTSVKKKSLNPDWRQKRRSNNNSESETEKGHEADDGESFYMSLEGEYTHDVLLKIYDWNKNSKPELMGIITLKVKPGRHMVKKRKWLIVPKGSAPHASGHLKVEMNTKILKPVGWKKKSSKKKKSTKPQEDQGVAQDLDAMVSSNCDNIKTQEQQQEHSSNKGRYRPSAAFHTTAFDDSFIGIEWSDDDEDQDNKSSNNNNPSSFTGQLPITGQQLRHSSNATNTSTITTRRQRTSTVAFLKRQADFASKMNKVRQKTTQVKLIIFQGQDLVAKDYDMLGRETTSDPYVEVWIDHDINSPRLLGRTPTCEKTLDPVWLVTDKSKAGRKMAPPTFSFPIIGYHTQTIKFKIWDKDYGIGETDDLMGIVTIPLTPPPDKDENDDDDDANGNGNDDRSLLQTMDTRWYQVPVKSAAGARGRIKVGIIMQDVTKRDVKKKKKKKNSTTGKKKKKGDKEKKTKTTKKKVVKKKKTKRISQQNVDHTEDRNENFLSIIEPVQQKTTKLQLTISRGKGLSTIQKNFVGLGLGLKQSNPNPYVEVSAYDHIVGTTKTIQKEIDPNWELSSGQCGQGERFNMRLWGDNPHTISLKIYHEHANDRYISKRESEFYLGHVAIVVNPEAIEKKEWYKIEKGDTKDDDAGLLQVKIESIVLIPEKKKKKDNKNKKSSSSSNGQEGTTCIRNEKKKDDNFCLDKLVSGDSTSSSIKNRNGNGDESSSSSSDTDSSSDIYLEDSSSDDDEKKTITTTIINGNS